MMTSTVPAPPVIPLQDREEQWFLERRLAEQEITRQSFAERDRKLWELQRKVDMMEELLNRLSPTHPVPRAAPSSDWPLRHTPRRWRPR